MTELSQPQVNQALSEVMHPEINYSLVDLRMIENVSCKQDEVGLTLKLPFLHVAAKDLLIESVRKKLSDLDDSVRVQVNIEQMSQEERDRFAKMAREGWIS